MNGATPDPETQQLADDLAMDYQKVRILPDGSIACIDTLMFTTAIFTGCDRHGFERRFCFEDHALAYQRFAELQSAEDEPQGFIARRSA
jgi:hypothetical protein